MISPRHGRTLSGHPRLSFRKQDVDGRDKHGQDDSGVVPRRRLPRNKTVGHILFYLLGCASARIAIACAAGRLQEEAVVGRDYLETLALQFLSGAQAYPAAGAGALG